jgi:predicted metal-dependent hydrolase
LSTAQTETHNLKWFGDYTLRISNRAKHLRLCVTLQDGLVVVMPAGFDPSRVPEVLERKRSWLLKVHREIRRQRRCSEAQSDQPLPERINLRAVGEEWSVEYRSTASARVSAVQRGDRRLVVSGNVADTHACHEALKRWVSRKAHEHLVPWVKDLARQHRLRVKRVVIRAQKTLWGSCSNRRTISLNRKAIFLPPELVHYLLVHELCHISQPNHSSKFWALVASHCPDCRKLRRKLDKAGGVAPPWAEGTGLVQAQGARESEQIIDQQTTI